MIAEHAFVDPQLSQDVVVVVVLAVVVVSSMIIAIAAIMTVRRPRTMNLGTDYSRILGMVPDANNLPRDDVFGGISVVAAAAAAITTVLVDTINLVLPPPMCDCSLFFSIVVIPKHLQFLGRH